MNTADAYRAGTEDAANTLDVSAWVDRLAHVADADLGKAIAEIVVFDAPADSLASDSPDHETLSARIGAWARGYARVAAEMVRRARVIVTCACGRTYSRDEWLALPRVGVQRGVGTERLLLRNCVCRSTVAIEMPVDACLACGLAGDCACAPPGCGTCGGLECACAARIAGGAL